MVQDFEVAVLGQWGAFWVVHTLGLVIQDFAVPVSQLRAAGLEADWRLLHIEIVAVGYLTFWLLGIL